MGWSVSCRWLLCQHHAVGLAGLVAADEFAAIGGAALWGLSESPDGSPARLHSCGLPLPVAAAAIVHISGGRTTGVSLWLVFLAGPGCR